MRKLLLMMTALLCAGLTFAQNVSVSGVVTGADDGEPILGVSVAVMGTTQGTVTDINGKYSLTVPSNASLTFTFMGYETQTVAVQGKKTINVVLESDAKAIDEVIVVAYGTATKSSFTGSAATVKSESIESHITSNAVQALAGTTAGVQFTSVSGNPASSGQSIRIRGIGSISASSQPLYIVDGMPYDGAMSDINPNDIESMSVLKDASASAIYGARGANGVILITTKKGGSNNVPNVKFDAKFGSNSRLVPNYDVITDPAQYYETYFKLLYNKQLYSGKTEGEAYTAAYAQLFDSNNGGLGYQIYTIPEGQNLIGTNFRLNPNAVMGYSDGEYYYQADDWYNEVYHNSFRQEYNLSVSGKSDNGKLTYYSNFGFLDDGGMVNNSDYKRFTGRINAEYKAKDWLTVTSNVSYSYSDSQNPDYSTSSWASSGNLFYITNTIAPIYPLYVRNADGTIKKVDGRIQYDANQTNFKRPGVVGNAVRDNEFDVSKSYADVLNAKIGVTLTPFRGFSLAANLGVFDDNTRSNELGSQYASSSSYDGYAYVAHGRSFGINSQILAEYKSEIALKHNIDVLAGFEQYNYKYMSLTGFNTNLFNPYIGELNNADGKASMSTTSYTTRYMTEGFLARAQYDYDGKYFVSASFRRDASSRFAEDQRWGNFGSFGGAWLISKEGFMNDVKWVDMLKLKASWGVQGNDNLGSYFPYSDQYTHSYNESTGEYSLTLSYKGNPALTWESSHAINAGIDFELFKGRFNGSIEVYNRKTTDLLYSKAVPASSGNPTGSFPLNVGSLRNLGVEVTLDGSFIRTKNFEWGWNLNASHYKNEILSLDESISKDGQKASYYILKIGGSVHEAYMLKSAGLSNEGEALYYYKEIAKKDDGTNKVDADGQPVYTGNDLITNDPTKADQYDCGNVYPKILGGFGTTIQYKGFDLMAQFSYQLGGKYYDGSYQALMHTQSNAGSAMHKDLLKAWTPENTNTDIPRMDGNYLLAQTACDRFLISSDYLCLNNAQIGYTVPAKIAKKMKMGSLRFYVAGENLFLLSKRQGLDPRYGTGLGSYTAGSAMNSNDYGAMRNITGGVTLTF